MNNIRDWILTLESQKRDIPRIITLQHLPFQDALELAERSDVTIFQIDGKLYTRPSDIRPR